MTSGQIFHFKAKVFSLEDFILCRICGSSWRFAFRPSPPNPTIYYFTCMFASPTSTCGNSAKEHLLSWGWNCLLSCNSILLSKIASPNPVSRSTFEPYRKATETLRMKFSSNFEETGFEFCLEPWLGDWKNCVHLLFQSVGNTSPFLSHLLVTNIHAFYVYGAQARSSFALNTITHFEIILSLKSISLYSGTHYTQY